VQVDRKIKELALSEYASRIASTYSGGNKRKLSVAMAMVGKPLIVFLDGKEGGSEEEGRGGRKEEGGRRIFVMKHGLTHRWWWWWW